MSPCAKIITYRVDPRFSSAAHALAFASGVESKGERGALIAKKIRQYVETIRQKYVLLDTIANQWCPGVWTAAKATPVRRDHPPEVRAPRHDCKPVVPGCLDRGQGDARGHVRCPPCDVVDRGRRQAGRGAESAEDRREQDVVGRLWEGPRPAAP